MTAPEVHLVVPGPLDQRTGGSIYDRRMVDGLRRRGWIVIVHELGAARPGDGSPPGIRPAPDDGPARSLLDGSSARLPDGALVVLDGLVSRGAPDLVRAAAARLRLLVLVHLLAEDDPAVGPGDGGEAAALERQALGASAGVIATSPSTAVRLAQLAIDPARIRTVQPGTDRAPQAVGPSHGEPVQLLCVAAVTRGKGQDVLVRALARLADVPWTCVCAGSLSRDATFAGSVLAQVRDVGLTDRVRFLGEVDRENFESLYLSSSIFVLPSSFESYGMALVEAMARGLPIVSSRVGAIPDTVPAGTGILVPVGDDAALAVTLRSLIGVGPREQAAARQRRQALGAAARRHAIRLPDWEQTAAELERALMELGGGP